VRFVIGLNHIMHITARVILPYDCKLFILFIGVIHLFVFTDVLYFKRLVGYVVSALIELG
jgi:hypothetical protein